tara:strand:+ start:41 stop:1078 length:1038 start_codon:yes stop_codon:yes gene_type:complete
MATKQLLQILLKSREGIKSGAIKVKDVVEEYLTSTGARTISPEERYTINKEFTELAPSNVIDDVFGDFQGLQDDAGDVAEKIRGPNVQKAGEMSDTAFTDKVMKDRGIELRGDESFGEILEKFKTKEEGLGSLFPKGEPGSIFDQKNTNREEVAEFIRKMRGAGIKNEDIQKVIREETTFDPQPARRGDPNAPKEVVNLGQGKRAATTLARAADMKADTKIKQEFLSELDEKIAEKGPRFFNEEYQGFDSYGALINNEGIRIRNAIYDDLEEMGVDEETIGRIIRAANEVAERRPYEPERFMASIKDDLEINEINYNTDFWDNYISKTLELSTKPEPRFEYGGMV